MDGVKKTDRIYRVWSPVQSGIALGAAILWVVLPGPIILIWAAPMVNIIILYLVAGGKERANPANLVSLLRVCVTGTVFFMQQSLLSMWLLLIIILTITELLDWVDGRLAARFGPTRIGEIADEEADAFFILTVSALLLRTELFGPWVLTFGLLRYFFTVVFELFPRTGGFPRLFSGYSRTVCGISAGVLIAGFALFFPPVIRITAASAALGLLVISFAWEAVLRIRPLLPLFRAVGLLESYAVYYLVPGKRFRMRRLYERFLSEGNLAFDVGAHLGNRIRVWRDMGVRVVAVEPNPECFAFLSAVYGPDARVELISAASGAEAGTGSLHVDPRNPTLATVSKGWIREVENTAPFAGIRWERSHPVRMVTLDGLIAEFGPPDFIKIDTEGFDHRVLEGLSIPVKGLSFEYLPGSAHIAEGALARVEALGGYEYNLSPRETMRFRWREWHSAEAVKEFLSDLSEGDTAGDVYARLRGSGS